MAMKILMKANNININDGMKMAIYYVIVIIMKMWHLK
jgi:hypothetical protein